jgi:hypothetical protein
MTVTLKNLSLLDIARIGRFMDDYNEKFRGTFYFDNREEYTEYQAYKAAGRIVLGEPGMFDEELVRKYYEDIVRSEAFTKAGKLRGFYVRNMR